METKISKGEWILNRDNTITATHDRVLIAQICSAGNNEIAQQANAQLIIEAGNVANETGKTPRQLAEENKELLEALQYAIKTIEAFALHPSIVIKAQNAIKKATQ